MLQNVVLFSLLALAAEAIGTEHETPRTNDAILDIAELNKQILQQIVIAAKDFDGEYVKVKIFGQETVKSTGELLNASVTITSNSINNLLKEAGLEGLVCVGDQIEKIEAVPVKAVSDVNACVNKQLGILKGYTEDRIKELNVFLDLPISLLTDLKKCNIVDLICKSKVLAKTISAIGKVVADIITIAVKLIEKFVIVTEDIGKCQTSIIDNSLQEIITTGAGVKECLNNIIGGLGK